MLVMYFLYLILRKLRDYNEESYALIILLKREMVKLK